MRFSIRRVLVPLALLGSVAFLAACGGEVSIGEETVSSDNLEQQASTALTKQVGQEPASINCPDDLKAEVGESEVCTLEDQAGGTYDMTITITSVEDDGNVKFDIDVGDLKSIDVPDQSNPKK